MSVEHEITIWCDGCGNWERVSESSAARARQQLRKGVGWSCVQGVDLCPSCVKRKRVQTLAKDHEPDGVLLVNDDRTGEDYCPDPDPGNGDGFDRDY